MKRFAVFDIDGTLIRWQLYHAVVEKLAQQGLLGEKAHKQLHEARMVWKRREHPESFRAYELELINIYEAALPEITTKQFDQAAEAVASEYKEQVYTYTRALIANLKEQGYFLIAISGSHHELIEPVAKQYGFDVWVGSTFERKGDRFTGKSFIASHNKREILAKLIKEHTLDSKGSYGVGDSKSDAPLLEAAEHPIAFNPDRSLLELAKKHRWSVVIERKNVVYELKEDHGHYVLS